MDLVYPSFVVAVYNFVRAILFGNGSLDLFRQKPFPNLEESSRDLSLRDIHFKIKSSRIFGKRFAFFVNGAFFANGSYICTAMKATIL